MLSMLSVCILRKVMMTTEKPYAAREELANTLTHGLGALAALIGAVTLIALAAAMGDGLRLIAVAIYGCSLVLLYTASTLYHAARREALKTKLEIFDHCAIYVLIAGTYTPFTLVSLSGIWGWGMFVLIWGLTLLGIALKIRFIGRFPLLSTAIYIVMGWLVVLAAGPLVQALSTSTLIWLVLGGVVYTAGTYFYHNHRLPFGHAIWHLFVLGGSVCHFLAVATV
jgi:hemolysin III